MNKTQTEIPRKRSRKFTNDIIEDHGSWLLVDISTPKHPKATMAVDTGVFEEHDGGRIHAKWCTGCSYIYAKYSRDGAMCLVHRDVVSGEEIDHIHHGSMSFVDNRISNLRVVTTSQNQMNASVRSDNSSGIKGVDFYKRMGKWRAQIVISGKNKNLGYYDNIDFAIGARQQAEREYFGDFAFKGEK